MDYRSALVRERESLEKRLGEIKQILDEYEALERRASMVVGVEQGPVSRHDTQRQLPARIVGPSLEVQDITAPTEFESQLREVMSRIDTPITRKNLLLALKKKGVSVGGKNELNTLGTRLYRLDWVENLKGHGYWLTDRDYRPANYWANSNSERSAASLV